MHCCDVHILFLRLKKSHSYAYTVRGCSIFCENGLGSRC